MSQPPVGPYPLPIGVGDAVALTYDAWVAVLRAEPGIWSGGAAESYAMARQADVDAARRAHDLVDAAVVALRAMHASGTSAFLAFQGLSVPAFGTSVPPYAPPRQPTPAVGRPSPTRGSAV